MAKREELVVNKVTGPDGVEIAPSGSGRTSLLKTAAGTTTLVAAVPRVDRRVLILLTVDTTYAAGDGAAPIHSIGQTGTTTKFVNAKATGTAGDKVMFDGVLSAGTALILTATAATGTTSTGAITVTAMAV